MNECDQEYVPELLFFFCFGFFWMNGDLYNTHTHTQGAHLWRARWWFCWRQHHSLLCLLCALLITQSSHGTECVDNDQKATGLPDQIFALAFTILPIARFCIFMWTNGLFMYRLPLWSRTAAFTLRYVVGRSVPFAAQRLCHRAGHWLIHLYAQCHLLLLLVQVRAYTPGWCIFT